MSGSSNTQHKTSVFSSHDSNLHLMESPQASFA